MQYPLAQLAALCEAHPIQPKILFVPNLQAGYDLTTALAAAKIAWVNLHITTPRGLAEQEVGPQLHSQNWKHLPQDADLFFLEDLLAEALKADPDGYFARATTGPGLTRSFLRTLHAMRIAGINPDHIQPTNSNKHRLLETLYQSYIARLETDRTYDNATLFREALRRQDKPSPETICFAILDETPLGALAYQYLQKRTGNALYRIGRPDYGLPPPVQSAAARFPDAPFPETTSFQIGIGGHLLTRGLTPEDRATIHLKETLGTETEVHTILRDIQHRNLSLDTVEIVYTTDTPYLTLLRDTVERFELPATFAAGVPVHLTRPGSSLLGFYRWIGTGFDANELIALCRAGLIAFSEVDMPEPYEVAQVLTQAHVTQGRDQYTHALNRMETDLRDTEGPEGQHRQEQIQADLKRLAGVRNILDRLFAFLPNHPESDFKTLTQASLQYLQHNAPIRSPIDTSALDSLIERLALLGETIHVSDTPQRLATRLTELFANHRVETAAAQPGHLSIAPLERAGYTHRKHIYLLGLDEGSFPGGISEDPLLLDGDRTALSAELSLHRTRPAEQVWHLIRLLGMAPGPVTLLSTRRSLADGRESYPSALFQKMAEQMNLGDLPLLPPLPEAPEQALDLTETMLISHPSEGSAQAIQNRFPWLQSGATARRAREHPGLTRFDGFLGRPTPELNLIKGHTVLSASRLETLAGCPYRYFLAYILRITPPDEIEDDPTHWLTPLDFGALLHRLFRRFMETLEERGERPDRDRHADLLDQLLRQEIEIHKEKIPVQHQAAYRFDVKRLETAAKVFLSVEADKTDVEPVGFELSFGFGETDGLNREDPVPIRLSKDIQFRLQGQIDRIDRTEDGYHIWDYKTGSMAPYDETDLLKRGTHLQWVLYAYALEHIFKQHNRPGPVLQSGYVFPSDREHGRDISETPPPPKALAEVLTPLFELVVKGGFFHTQKEDRCTYCQFNRICADEKRLPKDMKDIQEHTTDASLADLLDTLNRWMHV